MSETLAANTTQHAACSTAAAVSLTPPPPLLPPLLLLLVAGVYDGKGCSGSAQFVEDHAVVLVGNSPDHKGYSKKQHQQTLSTMCYSTLPSTCFCWSPLCNILLTAVCRPRLQDIYVHSCVLGGVNLVCLKQVFG